MQCLLDVGCTNRVTLGGWDDDHVRSVLQKINNCLISFVVDETPADPAFHQHSCCCSCQPGNQTSYQLPLYPS